MIKNQTKFNISGFTLIEIMVALAVFGLLAVVAVGAVVSLTANYKLVENESLAFRDTRSAFETMVTEIRTGSTYGCYISDVPQAECTAGFEFRFLNDQGQQISYKLADVLGNSRTQLVRIDSASGRTAAITGPDIDITTAYFDLNGQDSTDTEQPSVRISIVANWYRGGEQEQFHYGTFITQRNLDNEN